MNKSSTSEENTKYCNEEDDDEDTDKYVDLDETTSSILSTISLKSDSTSEKEPEASSSLDDIGSNLIESNLFNLFECKQIEKIKTYITNLDFSQLKQKCINNILLQCLSLSKLAKDDPKNNSIKSLELIELLMLKLNSTSCYFMCWDDGVCSSIVKLYVSQSRQFTPYTICFLLRCNDICLIRQVIESNLVEEHCNGDCLNWHLMFVTSYHERFFTSCFSNLFEGFLARFILLCKLRCSADQKRYFLTWFAGSLHLYTDEYFLKNEEMRFKQVLVKLFEGLILNGLLSEKEFKILFQMMVRRNEEMVFLMDKKPPSKEFYVSLNPNESNANSSKSQAAVNSSMNAYYPLLASLYPLSLKNQCRLVIKQHVNKYTKSYIEQLPLPCNVKRFLLFENECESVFKSFNFMKNHK